MARKNRSRQRPQHGKPKRTSKRPRGWVKPADLPRAQHLLDPWLEREGKAA